MRTTQLVNGIPSSEFPSDRNSVHKVAKYSLQPATMATKRRSSLSTRLSIFVFIASAHTAQNEQQEDLSGQALIRKHLSTEEITLQSINSSEESLCPGETFIEFLSFC